MPKSGENIPPYRTLNPSRGRKEGMSRRDFLKSAAVATAIGVAGVAIGKTDPLTKGFEAVAEWAKEGPTDAQKEGAPFYLSVKKEHSEDILKDVEVIGDEDENGKLIKAKARNKPWVSESSSHLQSDERKGDVLEELAIGYRIPEGIIVKGNNLFKGEGLWLLWPKDPNKVVPEGMRFTYVGGLRTGDRLDEVQHFPLESVKLPS